LIIIQNLPSETFIRPLRALNLNKCSQTAQNRGYKIVRSATKGTKRKKVKKSLKKGLTNGNESGIIYKLSRRAQAKASSEVIEN